MSFSSSFHCYCLQTHLFNSGKYLFLAVRDLTIEMSKLWQKRGFSRAVLWEFLINVLGIPDDTKTEIKPIFTTCSRSHHTFTGLMVLLQICSCLIVLILANMSNI